MLHVAVFSRVRMRGEDVNLTWETMLTISLQVLIKGQIEVQATQRTLKKKKTQFLPACSHLCDLRLELGCSSERTARTNKHEDVFQRFQTLCNRPQKFHVSSCKKCRLYVALQTETLHLPPKLKELS